MLPHYRTHSPGFDEICTTTHEFKGLSFAVIPVNHFGKGKAKKETRDLAAT
jgi:hypothetical protein